jgi:hypothetical protein
MWAIKDLTREWWGHVNDDRGTDTDSGQQHWKGIIFNLMNFKILN